MAEMTTQQTMEYLKHISELETSVYQQTTVITMAHENLVEPEIKMKNVTKPCEPRYPDMPKEPKFNDIFESQAYIGMFGMGLCLLGLITYVLSFRFLYFGMGLGAVAISIIVALVLTAYQYFSQQASYPQELENYKRIKQKADEDYNIALEKYNWEFKLETQQFEEKHQTAQRAYGIAVDEVKKLDGPLEETKRLLDVAYSADIIFPKYRNMIAMCTMYEYFASGRCTELMGPTGAYNLYEAESRQNIIINQLEMVNKNLEQVKQNQYVLYQGIVETNRILEGVSADIKDILSMTADITVSSRITAFCSQIIAANAQVQTYLEIVD